MVSKVSNFGNATTVHQAFEFVNHIRIALIEYNLVGYCRAQQVLTQTVKMNELFSPTGLASQVLYVLTWNTCNNQHCLVSTFPEP